MDTTLPALEKYDSEQLRPMPLWESLLILVAITVLGILCFYGIRPCLERQGLAASPAYLVSISVAFVVIVDALVSVLASAGRAEKRSGLILWSSTDQEHLGGRVRPRSE